MIDLPVFVAKKILITGDLGFIDSNLARRLVNEGAVVRNIRS